MAHHVGAVARRVRRPVTVELHVDEEVVVGLGDLDPERATRTHSSASGCRLPRTMTVAPPLPTTDRHARSYRYRRYAASETTWTSSSSWSPGWTCSGGRSSTTMTGRHAGAGRRSRAWGSAGGPAPRAHRRGAVGEAELGEAPGRPVLEPAEALDLVAQQAGLVALGGLAPVLVGVEGARGHVALEGGQVQAVVAGQALPVQVGPALGLDEVVGLGHGRGAELADEPGQSGPAGQEGGESRSSATFQPNQRWLSVPSSWGRCGYTPEWAITGRVPSLRSSTDLMARSSSDRFHVGSAWEASARVATTSAPPGIALGVGLDVDGERFVVAAPQEHRRMVSQQVHGLPGLAPGLVLDPRGHSPTAVGGPARPASRPRRRPGTAPGAPRGRAGAGSRAPRRGPGPRPGPSPPRWPRPGPCGSVPGWRP